MNNETTMKAKLAALAAENKRLRRVAQNSRHDTLLKRVTIDAQQLLLWRYSGLSVSRRNAEEMGMTQRRWSWARALLQYARVHDDRDVTPDSFDEALAALKTAVGALAHSGLEMLKFRLPQHVLLSNYRDKAAAKGADKGAGKGAANNQVKKLASTRDDTRGRGALSRGIGRDRRAEIEQRLNRTGGHNEQL